MFGQSTRIRPADVRDGLSNTAAMSERVRGHDDYLRVDVLADQFRLAAPWTEDTFRAWYPRFQPMEPVVALPQAA